MSEIKIIKTPWWRMIKIKRKIKKWNKKYGNRPMTVNEINEAIMNWRALDD